MYRIPIDHDILEDHGVFSPRALSDELVFKLSVTSAGSVVRGLESDLNNIQLEYEVMQGKELAENRC